MNWLDENGVPPGAGDEGGGAEVSTRDPGGANRGGDFLAEAMNALRTGESRTSRPQTADSTCNRAAG